MQAAVFYGKKNLKTEDLPMPQPQATEVVIKVMACGICGTDMHIFEGDEGAGTTPPGTVLGHEFAGVVTAVGSAVSGVSIGDRVCVDPNVLCGHCDYCHRAVGQFCENRIGIGTTVNGGFAEYCAVPVSQVYRVPEDTPFAAAAMTEPVACCLHGMDLCHIGDADTVLIIGGGTIGMIMLQLAIAAGAAQCILAEPVAEKRRQAEKYGSALCLDPREGDLAQQLQENGIGPVTCVIECVGRPETMEQAIRCAGKKAVVMLFGLTAPQATISVKPFELFKKELEIKASFINPYTQQRALDLITSGRIDVSGLVYATAPLSKLPEILADSESRRRGKWIICPQQ